MTRYLFILGLAVCALGANAGEDVAFETIDVNGDGFISESEFVTWKTSADKAAPAEALVMFIEIDTDASGMISETEMEAAKAKMAAEERDIPDHSDDTM